MRKPQNWRERPDRDPEKETARLRERFRAVTRRLDRRASIGGRGSVRPWWDVIAVAAVVVVVLGWLWVSQGHGL